MATPEQIRRRGRWSLVLGTIIAALLFVAAGLADDVPNNLDGTIDATLESMSLTVGGADSSVRFQLAPSNADAKNGCNLTGSGSQLVLGVTSSDTSVATLGASSVTITACNTLSSPISVHAVGAGTANVTLSFTSVTTDSAATSASDYNLLPGAFTVTVTTPPPSDSTAPVITPNVSGTLGNNGWYVSDVTVSWNVIDNESAISSSTGCGTTTITSDTGGTTLTCSATSAGGTSSQSVTIKRDATAPTISGSASPAPNGNGWNNTDVTVSFTCGDGLSGIASCPSAQILSTEGASQSATGTAFDEAGNSASTTVSGINIDKTKPTASATPSPAANANGWNNTDVTVSFGGSDPGGSGIDFCDTAVVLSSEGAGQSASGTCTDKAGNVSDPAAASGINIDKTNPTVGLVDGPADGGSYYFGLVPAAPTCTASDTLSGLDGACSVSGYATTVGSHTVTAGALDKAGNSANESHTYTVLAWTLNGFFQPVDMGTSVWNAVKGGSTVPLKFKVFAGPTELTDTSIVTVLKAAQVACTSGSEDTVEELAPTGGTSLRYDSTGGQFIYNWQTPKKPGYCFRVTVGTTDGSSLVANFKLK